MLVLIATLLPLVATASPAGERFLAAEGIAVQAAAAIPAAADPAWAKVTPVPVAVVPQLAVTLNDKDANLARDRRAPGHIAVRALATPKELALLLEWDDATLDRFDGADPASFGDAAAIEVPVRFGADVPLPYVGMGNANNPVLVHMVRATGAATQTRNAVAEGFGSLTRADLPWMRAELAAAGPARWRALFVRPLVAAEHRVDAALVPVAFAVWDGARDQRGGNKLLSGWRFLRMPGRMPTAAQLDALSYGYGANDLGDAQRGKAIVEAVCLSCHRVGNKGYAPPDAAPALTVVGVLSSPSYLRDALLTPSAVLVPSLGANRRQDRSKARDANGAYPSAEAGFTTVDAQEHAVSRMPSFAAMPPAQLADVIAYLKTLGTEQVTP